MDRPDIESILARAEASGRMHGLADLARYALELERKLAEAHASFRSCVRHRCYCDACTAVRARLK